MTCSIRFLFSSRATKSQRSRKVTDIARATSAAPTFFPPLHLASGTDDYALVDGGVYVNNPSMAAYVEARTLYPLAQRIVVVSVGSGDRNDEISYPQGKKWGLLGWAKQIVPVLMDSVSEAVDFEMSALPECTYFRLQAPDLSVAASAMDNVTPENIANLQSIAKSYVASQAAYLAKICAELKSGRGSDMPGIGRGWLNVCKSVYGQVAARAACQKSCDIPAISWGAGDLRRSAAIFASSVATK